MTGQEQMPDVEAPVKVEIEPESKEIPNLPPVGGYTGPRPIQSKVRQLNKEQDPLAYKDAGAEEKVSEPAAEEAEGSKDEATDTEEGIGKDADSKPLGEDTVADDDDSDFASEPEEAAADSEPSGSEANDGAGEDTGAKLDYAELWEQEKAERSRLQQQIFDDRARRRSPSDEDLHWNDPRMQRAFAAIQSGDNEAMSKIDPATLAQAKTQLAKAEEVTRSFAFNPAGFLDNMVLPVVQELVRHQVGKELKDREFSSKHGDYLKANSRRMADLSRQTGVTDQKALLLLLQKEDQIRNLSSQRNRAEGQANHAKKLQAETRARMKPPQGQKVRLVPRNVEPTFIDDFGRKQPKTPLQIAREMQGLV